MLAVTSSAETMYAKFLKHAEEGNALRSAAAAMNQELVVIYRLNYKQLDFSLSITSIKFITLSPAEKFLHRKTFLVTQAKGSDSCFDMDQREYSGFGGNPDDVTVAGYSVSAASAELMMLLPAAQGLFNKVILESGSGVASWLSIQELWNWLKI
ncbi:Cholinesterase [Eumeta japonica]|uniref:Cholinesterase n=1 Tax=Eumeta variegata TaxID=151549 RepID=A0A4C1SFX6_EUMVA|nr:Cholinesterase [Eumeta japonica]